MTTFTSEDREMAQKLVEEAPYHPGYEDAVIIKGISDDEFIKNDDIILMIKMNDRHLSTAKKIVDFIKNQHSSK